MGGGGQYVLPFLSMMLGGQSQPQPPQPQIGMMPPAPAPSPAATYGIPGLGSAADYMNQGQTSPALRMANQMFAGLPPAPAPSTLTGILQNLTPEDWARILQGVYKP